MLGARVPSLGGNAAQNSLKAHGLGFGNLNVLNEHGLIISDYNSWFDCQTVDLKTSIRIPFMFQNHSWVLIPINQRKPSNNFKLSGVALTRAGQELSRIVDLHPMDDFEKDLKEFFLKQDLYMTKI